jgi:hypothetical protein
MLKATTKNTNNKQDLLGQYFTPNDTIKRHMSKINLSDFDIIVEPSFGSGNFLNYLKETYKKTEIIGLEIDDEIYKEFKGIKTYNKNFYDFNYDFNNKKVVFVGNPPYRTPAYSLNTHNNYVKKLLSKYNIVGIKEEAIIFFVHTFDILQETSNNFEIHYILPKAIFQGNSKSYKSFLTFLEHNLNLTNVINIENDFEGVDQDLVLVSYKSGKQNKDIILDGLKKDLFSFYGQTEDYFDYRDIFKKTYLGSVPAESIFISIKGESKDDFKDRLKKVFSMDLSIANLKKYLNYKGKYHLKVFSGSNEEGKSKKWETIYSYIDEINKKGLLTISDLDNDDNYKPFKHRKEDRTYFRLENLKKVSFIYILNPNPGKSLYFTSNPSKTSTDYFGFCDYDINRNSSPGSMRTVPLESLEDNITDSFKDYWKTQTSRPLTDLPDYIIHISNSKWYKDLKNKYHRIYFGVPKVFDNKF